MSAPVLEREGLGDLLEKNIAASLVRQRKILGDVEPSCSTIVDAVAELMSSGKRLRAAFCYWGWRGADGPAKDPIIIQAASALEYFHAAGLIHDDIIDRANYRRGKPTAHRRFTTSHRERDGLGDAEDYGQAVALLAGDLCFGWADELFTGCGAPPVQLGAAQLVFNRMRTEVNCGQFLDVTEQTTAIDTTPAAAVRAQHVIRYKSARYSVQAPLLIGGVLAGAEPPLLDTYTQIGLPLGEAFQLRDDVLGIFGNPRYTGKPAGDDLREGKRTLIMAKVFATATPQQREVLDRYFGRPDLDDAGIEQLRTVIRDTGAQAAVEETVTQLTTQARTALHQASLPQPVTEILGTLIDAATNRVA